MSVTPIHKKQIYDVLIFGAGVSGIGCAATLRQKSPEKTWTILEMRHDLGGTWDLFKYPGIRSDSDLYTFSYEFKPWDRKRSIARGDEIKDYLDDTAKEFDVKDHIQFHTKILSCSWDSQQALWTVRVENTKTGEQSDVFGRWIFSGTGYYDYDKGYRPSFPNEDAYKGEIIHPQHWPEDLDYSGKRIAVIGSGATAVTLLPSLAEKAAHVIQVQRTPTYVLPVPQVDPWQYLFRPFVSKNTLHRLMRAKNILRQKLLWGASRRFPRMMRQFIRLVNKVYLPSHYPVDTHFNPPYDPWDQRLCAVPDGDLYKSLRKGECSIVTGTIARFTEKGIEMSSGETVEADIIVTATGLNIKLLGGVTYTVDGEEIDWSQRVVFKGMMYNGIPNFVMALGYTQSSWTLKVGLLCEYLCRLFAEMDRRGMAVCTPELPDRPMELRPLLDFGAGYVRRAIDKMPRQGDAFPWEMTFNYSEDAEMMKEGEVVAPELRLSPLPEALAYAAE
ncbi:Flavin-containing monooxygenase FMO [Parvularcula bermudensis HTCC2503]|uniref:Flavin-containing monooxygenase FMO n=1 Tax=Parvularcula bermudensis (strain ATCC BAA-594 / HTCC2503 / KCTC 12087) TaxID=314260 RepID=E0TBD1_PARBH|nr:NAD(P)/FAD-dependent oxidoreductase [Parvularcula bermudensis]ADM08335.1 Flavin-containing monooxygenase FMO [Parvularcula bermudensis HTCC2503]